MRRSSQQGSDAGFTLIEVLVVLTLAAAIMTLTPAALRFGQRALHVAADVEQRTFDREAMAALTRRLAGAREVYEADSSGISRLVFDGAPDRLMFVTELAHGPAGGGLYQVNLTRDAAVSNLTLSLAPWPAPEGAPAFVSQIPLGKADGLTLRYFGPDRDSGDLVWQSAWQRTDALPRAVEISTLGSGARTTLPVIVALQLALH